MCSECVNLQYNISLLVMSRSLFGVIKMVSKSNIHSPHEIISKAGKTGQNSRRKRNQSRDLFIHISNKSASIKTKDIPIESSKLLCFSFILFHSKLC